MVFILPQDCTTCILCNKNLYLQITLAENLHVLRLSTFKQQLRKAPNPHRRKTVRNNRDVTLSPYQESTAAQTKLYPKLVV